jgi:hypothetical protein
MSTPTKVAAKNDVAVSSVARYNSSGANTLEPGKSYKNRGGFDYIINSMFLFAVIGMCIKVFFGSETTADGRFGPANTIIYGYGIIALSILTVMFISYAVFDRIGRIEEKSKSESIINFLRSFLSSSTPSILTVIVLLWIITLNISHYTQINKGFVANEYYQLSASTSFLFMFQIICLFQYIKLYIKAKTDQNSVEGKNAIVNQGRMAFATYFITAINLIVVGMMTIILRFFSTDG